MSKIAKLIEKYCPEGVEYKTLGEISTMQRGTSLTKKNAVDGIYPVISGGREPAFYCDSFNRNDETITVAGSGAGAGYVQYWNGPIFVCDAFSVKGKQGVDTKFLYYCLTNLQEQIYATKKGGGVPHVHISSIEKFSIPVPPLPVQEEIVRILDSFTSLEAELEAELEARRKQYEYYRDKLIQNSKLKIENEWKRVKLGEICNIITAPKKLDKSSYLPEGNFPIIDQGQKYIIGYTNDASYVLPRKEYVIFGDHTREIKYVDFPFAQGADGLKILTASKEILPKFLYFCFKNARIQSRGYNRHWTIAREIEIPLPPLPIQQRIVNVLDKFDALVNDISNGLPAEIEARRKQYEYYRDKLLTF